MADRSATSVLFGFDFQANAAIVLMLENIKDMSHIRFEGCEDIDIKLNDGSHIFAQAKSVVKSSSDFTNVLKNLKKSLISLSDAYRTSHDNVKELIYITNSLNPFKEKHPNTIFWGPAQRKFASLPNDLQEKVFKALEGIENPLDTDKLKIQILPFETDNYTERYKAVIAVIGDFISHLGTNSIERSRIHEIWAKDLFLSGTRKDKSINLKKKDLIWPIIVLVTDNDDYDEYDVDDSEADELLSAYKDIINICSEKYEFVTRVLSDYNNFKTEDKSTKLESFIKSEGTNFRYLFDDTSIKLSNDLQEILIQIIIRNIIRKRIRVNHIKDAVNL